jgi:phenylalanyl-tRNA synthetase beta chain
MKFSESWLREWVNPALPSKTLCEKLTMAGLEVEELAPVAAAFSGIVVGEVLSVVKHPSAERLHVCDVSIGQSAPLNIVCAATNVKTGIKVPVATIGAKLPNNIEIKAATLRGVPSSGMLCSAVELGMAAESDGLFVLPADAPLGEDIRHYLKLDDNTIEIGITPNRGDCLSIRGVAREVSALTSTALKALTSPEMKPTIKDTLPVSIKAPIGCPRYVGRVIRGVKSAATPSWLSEKLRRSGIRSISPVVDVTNYVMLELGQPMHAFDLKTIDQEIIVRLSKEGEQISLLDESEKTLDANTLVIADHSKPLAIAGVMGGTTSSVTLNTTDIFLESAYFSPTVIARQRQYYQLNSDSAYRFERSVDATIQREAIERATQLILEITGGKAGPVIEVKDEVFLPKPVTISLSTKKVAKVLGITIPDETIDDILKRLQFVPRHTHKAIFLHQDEIKVGVPSFRADITLPEDVIEEIARVYGYDLIPTHSLIAGLDIHLNHSKQTDLMVLRQALSDQGFNEVVTYSFVGKKMQALINLQVEVEELVNPVSAEMSVMRTSLWPGLLEALLYNKSRQQQRIRLFEIGRCFIRNHQGLEQPQKLAGLTSGPVFPEQWGMPVREADFFDLKGNLVNIFKPYISSNDLSFEPAAHPALHPGQTAAVLHKGKAIGLIGAIHPSVIQALDLNGQANVYVFEVDLLALPVVRTHAISEVSKFPEIRRDIAIILNQAIPVNAIQDTIIKSAGDWLKDVFIFDVYQGKGITPGQKSVALGLILQHPTRTLVDDEVTKLVDQVVSTLKGKFGAELRS